MFKREFKKNVKDKLMRSEASIENLKKLIEKIIKIDDMLYDRVMKRRYENSHERSEIYAERDIVSEEKSYFKSERTFLTEITFMKLNAITRRKEMNFKIKRGNINKKACYECDKLSHFARNCRNKVKQQRQFNAMLRKISNKKERKKNKRQRLEIFDNQLDEQ